VGRIVWEEDLSTGGVGDEMHISFLQKKKLHQEVASFGRLHSDGIVRKVVNTLSVERSVLEKSVQIIPRLFEVLVFLTGTLLCHLAFEGAAVVFVMIDVSLPSW